MIAEKVEQPRGGDRAVFGRCTTVKDGDVFITHSQEAALFKAGRFHTFVEPPSACRACCTLSDGTVFLLCGREGRSPLKAYMLDLDSCTYTTVKPVEQLACIEGAMYCHALSDRKVLIRGTDATFIYDARTESCLRDSSIHMPPGAACCVLTDGRLFVCGGRERNTFGVVTESNSSCVYFPL